MPLHSFTIYTVRLLHLIRVEIQQPQVPHPPGEEMDWGGGSAQGNRHHESDNLMPPPRTRIRPFSPRRRACPEPAEGKPAGLQRESGCFKVRDMRGRHASENPDGRSGAAGHSLRQHTQRQRQHGRGHQAREHVVGHYAQAAAQAAVGPAYGKGFPHIE